MLAKIDAKMFSLIYMKEFRKITSFTQLSKIIINVATFSKTTKIVVYLFEFMLCFPTVLPNFCETKCYEINQLNSLGSNRIVWWKNNKWNSRVTEFFNLWEVPFFPSEALFFGRIHGMSWATNGSLDESLDSRLFYRYINIHLVHTSKYS